MRRTASVARVTGPPGQRERSAARAMCALLASLWLVGCGGDGGGGGVPAAVPRNALADSTPSTSASPFVFDLPGMRSSARTAVAGNPIETVLRRCTVTLREGEECTLTELPLIGMQTADPTVDDIMQRVVVSHDWMALRLRQVLQVMPREVLLLTRGITGVVISYDIRPSFYTTRTGAIYLDPEGLWLTQAEAAVIDDAPDFRSSFGNELDFRMLWRYVRNNAYVTRPPTSGTRSIEDIKLRMAALIFHELAHANDFFAPGAMASLPRTIPIPQAVSLALVPSSLLSAQLPLQSETMRSLARVSFRGNTATPAQRDLGPADVAAAFVPDHATDYYSYSTSREDLAMVFEEAMMLATFGVDRDVAVTVFPPVNSCDQYVVEWGERNRVVHPLIGERALFAIRHILPEYEDSVRSALTAEPPPTGMVRGVDWCNNRFLDAAPPNGKSAPAATAATVQPDPAGDAIRPWH